VSCPWGLAGGGDGAVGEDWLPSADVLRVSTPGGGGGGRAEPRPGDRRTTHRSNASRRDRPEIAVARPGM